MKMNKLFPLFLMLCFGVSSPSLGQPLFLIDEPLPQFLSLYEEIYDVEIASDITHEHPFNLRLEENIVWSENRAIFNSLLRLHGLKISRNGTSTSQLKLERIGDIQTWENEDFSVDERLGNTIESLANLTGPIHNVTMINESIPAVLSLLQEVIGKPILSGPAIPKVGIDLELLDLMSIKEFFLIIEDLLFEKGVVLVDSGSAYICAYPRELKKEHISVLYRYSAKDFGDGRPSGEDRRPVPRRRIIRRTEVKEADKCKPE